MSLNLSSARWSRLLVSLLCASSGLLAARAQTTAASATADTPVDLARFVVSATRTPQDPQTTASSVSVVPLEEVQLAQLPTLSAALAQEPGVALYTAGGYGGQTTILLRGASSHQTLFVVDGVRMNDRSATYQNFLGGADLGGIDRLEVLRGPQSTLYGSSALGGMILLETAHGRGAPAGSIQATAGSFDSFGANVSVAGGAHDFGYSASVGHFQTDNDRPQNQFRGWNEAARLEYQLTPALLVGATIRREDSTYYEPGSRFFPDNGKVEFANTLATAYAQVRIADDLTSRLTLASHLRDYVFSDSYGVSPQRNLRHILDWQNTWTPSDRAELVAGANVESSRYTVSGAPTSDHVAAGYVSGTVRPIAGVTLNAGLRHDDFHSVGGATTGRVGVAWLVEKNTKLRASYGTGFSAPGSDDVYGVPSYGQLPSPGLKPERSRGWDAGVDQTLLGGRATISATYFRNEFRDLFDYEIVDFTTYAGRTVNRARATTEGVEFAVIGRVTSDLFTRASYTYLDATDDATGAPLTRRPRHTADGEIAWTPVKAWTLGAGVHIVSDRIDGSKRIEDYTTARVFTSYTVLPSLVLKLRLENALNESYEEVYGYPSLPRAIFGSAEWRF